MLITTHVYRINKKLIHMRDYILKLLPYREKRNWSKYFRIKAVWRELLHFQNKSRNYMMYVSVGYLEMYSSLIIEASVKIIGNTLLFALISRTGPCLVRRTLIIISSFHQGNMDVVSCCTTSQSVRLVCVYVYVCVVLLLYVTFHFSGWREYLYHLLTIYWFIYNCTLPMMFLILWE